MMRRQTSLLRMLLAGCCALMLAACSNHTEITRAYVSPLLKNKDLEGVLVVGVAQQQASRIAFEDAFATALRHHGVRAVASHTLDIGKDAKSEAVIAAAGQADLDTIMVTRYMGAMADDVYHPGTIYYGIAPAYGPSYSGGFGGYYGHAYEVAYQQPVWTSNVTHTLVSDLYIAETKEHMWQAVSETLQAGGTRKLREDAIRALIGNLKEQGLLN